MSSTEEEEEEEEEETSSTFEQQAATSQHKKKTGFIQNVFQIANNPEYHKSIGFNSKGNFLEIRDCETLSTNVLPKYFQHSNISSFIRQLNNYGFRTKPSTYGVYQTFVHENFQKDRPDLLSSIVRKSSGRKVKKKSLFEQVSDFKQRESEYGQRIDHLNAQVKTLKEQNQMLLDENVRLRRSIETTFTRHPELASNNKQLLHESVSQQQGNRFQPQLFAPVIDQFPLNLPPINFNNNPTSSSSGGGGGSNNHILPLPPQEDGSFNWNNL